MTIKPVYAIVGPEPFLRQQALTDLLRRIAPDVDSLGIASFKGPVTSLAEVLDEARTASLLGGRRTVIVEDADEFITNHRAALERYCAAPATSNTLVFVCHSLPSHTRLHKAIAQIGEVVVVSAPVGRNLLGWIARRTDVAYGKTITPAAVQRLRDQIGDSPGLLDAELAKLATYVGERREITPSDVESLSGHTREEKVFAVMDAVLAGRPAAALRQWEQVLATDRAAPGRAIAGLAWSVRQLLKAKLEFDAGVSARALSYGLFTDPQTLERHLRSVDPDLLAEMQRDLLAADVATKTSASTFETAIEKFIITHSTRNQPKKKVG